MDIVRLDGSLHAALIENCTITSVNRYTACYVPGVSLNGVGNTVRATEIYDAPHTGVFISGNNHEVTGCDIHDVVQVRVPMRATEEMGGEMFVECGRYETSLSMGGYFWHLIFPFDRSQWAGDSGAIYSGRDTTYRGNRIVNNTLRNLISCAGEVYAICKCFSSSLRAILRHDAARLSTGKPAIPFTDLDDYMSGYVVAENSFFNTTCSFLGGGRDNTYLSNTYNLTRGCPPIKIDQRCFGNTSAELPPIILEFLGRVPYNTSQVIR